MRYTGDLGCRYRNIPHNMMLLKDTRSAKFEKCIICQKRFRWGKGPKGRVDNVEYLKAHIRQYAQKFGATKAVYNRIYKPSKCKILI